MNPLHHTVSMHCIRVLVDRSVELGMAREAVLDAAGIPASVFDNGQARALPAQFADLMTAIQNFTGDEFLGLTDKPGRVGMFPMMMRLMMGASSLGQALQQGCHFYRIMNDELCFTLRVENGLAYNSVQLRCPELDREHVLTETMLLCWYRTACWLINRRILLHEARFAYAMPAHVAEYHHMLPCQHLFNEQETMLVFDASYLELPLAQDYDALKELIRELPLRFFVKPAFQGSFSQQVRIRLSSELAQGFSSLEDTAQTFFMTGRTLRRKLLDEGTSYQEIKDGIRREQAMQLLRETTLAINDVALAVGFREASIFIKAFRQWAGMTPKAYRLRAALGPKALSHEAG